MVQRIRDHPGNLEGIVHEAETRHEVTRFQLRTNDQYTYFCYYYGNFRVDNGEYAEVNFRKQNPLAEQVKDNQEEGQRIFQSPRLSGKASPKLPKLMYVRVYEMKVFDKKEGELKHIYLAPRPIQ